MASNAWERAQDAIAHASQRATERDEDIVTPDTAVSPFDASSTTVLPHTMASRRGPGHDPDLTQRLRTNGHANGHHRAPDPRRPADPSGYSAQSGPSDDDGDATTVRFDTRSSTHPGTSPFPANPFPGGPGPAPVDDRDETPAEEPRRPWWKRLFGG
ncbi:hypothetical protein [Actinomycetospora flava]|uniref:Uncharacterized protein n=1 Tax=Actinomycetospora flava TaxID=3129232 RepID=A0ABU8MCM5_9PSEU